MRFANSPDLNSIFIKIGNDSIVGFVLLHFCLKTKNQAFNKKQFSKFAFALDPKYLKLNNLLKSLRMILHLR